MSKYVESLRIYREKRKIHGGEIFEDYFEAVTPEGAVLFGRFDLAMRATILRITGSYIPSPKIKPTKAAVKRKAEREFAKKRRVA